MLLKIAEVSLSIQAYVVPYGLTSHSLPRTFGPVITPAALAAIIGLSAVSALYLVFHSNWFAISVVCLFSLVAPHYSLAAIT